MNACGFGCGDNHFRARVGRKTRDIFGNRARQKLYILREIANMLT